MSFRYVAAEYVSEALLDMVTGKLKAVEKTLKADEEAQCEGLNMFKLRKIDLKPEVKPGDSGAKGLEHDCLF